MIVNPVKEALAFYQECLRNEQRTKRTSVISAPHSTASSGPNSPIKITPFVPTNNTLHKSQVPKTFKCITFIIIYMY